MRPICAPALGAKKAMRARDTVLNRDVAIEVLPDPAFAGFRILHYEDAEAPSDFGGRRTMRVVRLCAQKE